MLESERLVCSLCGARWEDDSEGTTCPHCGALVFGLYSSEPTAARHHPPLELVDVPAFGPGDLTLEDC